MILAEKRMLMVRQDEQDDDEQISEWTTCSDRLPYKEDEQSEKKKKEK